MDIVPQRKLRLSIAWLQSFDKNSPAPFAEAFPTCEAFYSAISFPDSDFFGFCKAFKGELDKLEFTLDCHAQRESLPAQQVFLALSKLAVDKVCQVLTKAAVEIQPLKFGDRGMLCEVIRGNQDDAVQIFRLFANVEHVCLSSGSRSAGDIPDDSTMYLDDFLVHTDLVNISDEIFQSFFAAWAGVLEEYFIRHPADMAKLEARVKTVRLAETLSPYLEVQKKQLSENLTREFQLTISLFPADITGTFPGIYEFIEQLSGKCLKYPGLFIQALVMTSYGWSAHCRADVRIVQCIDQCDFSQLSLGVVWDVLVYIFRESSTSNSRRDLEAVKLCYEEAASRLAAIDAVFTTLSETSVAEIPEVLKAQLASCWFSRPLQESIGISLSSSGYANSFFARLSVDRARAVLIYLKEQDTGLRSVYGVAPLLAGFAHTKELELLKIIFSLFIDDILFSKGEFRQDTVGLISQLLQQLSLSSLPRLFPCLLTAFLRLPRGDIAIMARSLHESRWRRLFAIFHPFLEWSINDPSAFEHICRLIGGLPGQSLANPGLLIQNLVNCYHKNRISSRWLSLEWLKSCRQSGDYTVVSKEQAWSVIVYIIGKGEQSASWKALHAALDQYCKALIPAAPAVVCEEDDDEADERHRKAVERLGDMLPMQNSDKGAGFFAERRLQARVAAASAAPVESQAAKENKEELLKVAGKIEFQTQRDAVTKMINEQLRPEEMRQLRENYRDDYTLSQALLATMEHRQEEAQQAAEQVFDPIQPRRPGMNNCGRG